jgi:hypothetical protein
MYRQPAYPSFSITNLPSLSELPAAAFVRLADAFPAQIQGSISKKQ